MGQNERVRHPTVALRGLRATLDLRVVDGYLAAAAYGQVDFGPVRNAAGGGDFLTWASHGRLVGAAGTQPGERRAGRALVAEGLATTIVGLGRDSGTTTYGENIGVLGAIKVYSTAAFVVSVADLTLTAGELSFNGIALGTIAAIVAFHLRWAVERARG